MVDFPLPVDPTIAVVLPGLNANEKSLSTVMSGRLG